MREKRKDPERKESELGFPKAEPCTGSREPCTETRQPYPAEKEAREEILEIGRRMYAKGFAAANDGNISCLVGPNSLWTTPTGVSKGFMTAAQLVKTDRLGRIKSGGKPSSELLMHLRVYDENPEVKAVVHAHPPAATAFACAGLALDKPVLAEAVVQLGQVPVAPFALPGTREVADAIAPFCRDYNALLLANHGALTWGRSLTEAWYRMETLEYYAVLLMLTGTLPAPAKSLGPQEVERLLACRQALGIGGPGIPPVPAS